MACGLHIDKITFVPRSDSPRVCIRYRCTGYMTDFADVAMLRSIPVCRAGCSGAVLGGAREKPD